MGSIAGQLLLLPEAIDDYVAADNPVRLSMPLSKGLILRVALVFERVEPKATGPSRLRARRSAEAVHLRLSSTGCGRAAVLRPNVIATLRCIWLLRSLKPDFKTIADFRSDNRAAFKKVFSGVRDIGAAA